MADPGKSAASQTDSYPSLEPISYDELMTMKFPAARWCVDGLVPYSGVTMLSGSPGSFKTWIMMYIAVCVSRGEPVFDHFGVSKSPVILVDEESELSLLADRFKMLTGNSGLEISIISMKDFALRADPIAELMRLIKSTGAKLVIFDSFARVSGVADENDAMAISRAFGVLKPLFRHGVAIIIAHHLKKAPGAGGLANAMRGSSDILAAAKSHISVQADSSGSVTLTQTKSRTAAVLDPFKVQINIQLTKSSFEYVGGLKKPSESKRLHALILERLADAPKPPNQVELLDSLSTDGKTVSSSHARKVLGEMVEAGEVIAEQGKRKTKLYSLPRRVDVPKTSDP